MPMLTGKCRTCNTTIKLDIGDKTKKDTIAHIQKWQTFHCPGQHVELSGPYPLHWPLDEWQVEDGQAPSDEEWLAELKSSYSEVLSHDELARLYEVQGFCMGCCIAIQRQTGEKAYFDFKPAPHSGQRYYYRI